MTNEDGSAVKAVEYPQSSNISQPLMQYYTTTTNAVLAEECDEIREVFINKNQKKFYKILNFRLSQYLPVPA